MTDASSPIPSARGLLEPRDYRFFRASSSLGGALVVTGLWARLFPALRTADRLE